MVEKPYVTSAAHRKATLISELEWSRAEMARNFRQVRSDLNLAAHLRESVTHRKTVWIAGAAIAGWVLSRLPGRKKTQPKATKAQPAVESKGWIKESEHAGFWLATLGALFNLAKPALTALASRKITELAARSDSASRNRFR